MNTQPILIIPAHNPTIRLTTLIQKLTTLIPSSKFIVVNDGSSQTSQNIFDELKRKDNIILLNHTRNLGKGAALKTALSYCLKNTISTIGAITLDADGQHLSEDVLALCNKFIDDPRTLWIGSRTFSKSTPWRSRFGNNLTAFIFKKLFHAPIKDTQSGLRAIPSALIPKLIALKSNGFEFELEMLIVAIKNEVPIRTIPIQTVYIDNNKHSNFNPITDSIKVYQVFFNYLMKRSVKNSQYNSKNNSY